MKEVTRITIKSVSGYGPWEESYKDVLTLTKDHIQYAYTPAVESPGHEALKWRYQTSNNRFYQEFHALSEMIVELMDKAVDLDVYDAGMTTFIVTFSDKSTIRREFTIDTEFYGCYELIKQMVPSFESVPVAIRTREREWDDL